MTTYSWGEFYETIKTCSEYGEEEQKKFSVFEALDKANSLEEIREIIKPLTETEINWLNSPCLDGIIYTITDPQKKLEEKEFVETFIYYTEKKLVNMNIKYFAGVGFSNIIKIMLKNSKIEDIDCSLWISSWHGYTNTVKLLLENGAKSDKSLYYACWEGHTDVVKLLLENGIAHVDTTVMIIRSSIQGYVEIVKLLLQYKLYSRTDIRECLTWLDARNVKHIEIAQVLNNMLKENNEN